MEGLVEIDKTLQPVPALAESWEVSADGLTYTFRLRKGVKWSDGVALAAKDFITSWKRLLAPGTHNDYAAFLFDLDHAEDFHKAIASRTSRQGGRARARCVDACRSSCAESCPTSRRCSRSG